MSKISCNNRLDLLFISRVIILNSVLQIKLQTVSLNEMLFEVSG